MKTPTINNNFPDLKLDVNKNTNQLNGTNKSPLSFKDVLDDLNQSQRTSDALIEQFSMGEDVDIHQVMIAAEQNDINFRIAMGIRDHLVEAYREVMRMNV